MKLQKFTSAQLAYQELFIGTLIYIAVLGLFNDYTSIVSAKSFSTIIYSSIILEILTYFAFQLKNATIAWLKPREGAIYKILMLFSVWFNMFISKFVFIWALDLVFGDYIAINGFFGILLVVASVTIVHKLAYVIFHKLEKG